MTNGMHVIYRAAAQATVAFADAAIHPASPLADSVTKICKAVDLLESEPCDYSDGMLLLSIIDDHVENLRRRGYVVSDGREL